MNQEKHFRFIWRINIEKARDDNIFIFTGHSVPKAAAARDVYTIQGTSNDYRHNPTQEKVNRNPHEMLQRRTPHEQRGMPRDHVTRSMPRDHVTRSMPRDHMSHDSRDHTPSDERWRGGYVAHDSSTQQNSLIRRSVNRSSNSPLSDGKKRLKQTRWVRTREPQFVGNLQI